jgi:hypothetical protein
MQIPSACLITRLRENLREEKMMENWQRVVGNCPGGEIQFSGSKISPGLWTVNGNSPPAALLFVRQFNVGDLDF